MTTPPRSRWPASPWPCPTPAPVGCRVDRLTPTWWPPSWVPRPTPPPTTSPPGSASPDRSRARPTSCWWNATGPRCSPCRSIPKGGPWPSATAASCSRPGPARPPTSARHGRSRRWWPPTLTSGGTACRPPRRMPMTTASAPSCWPARSNRPVWPGRRCGRACCAGGRTSRCPPSRTIRSTIWATTTPSSATRSARPGARGSSSPTSCPTTRSAPPRCTATSWPCTATRGAEPA